MKNILKAITFATTAHASQTRKGKPAVPYITHPLTVALILAKVGAEEDVIIGGILHDTIEDTEATYEVIKKEFGKNVADMVNDVTEQDKSLPWAVRKQRALEHIPQMSKGSLLIKSADQLHNMNDLLADYKKEGEIMFKKFNASKRDQIERYRKLIPAIEKAWKDNPLLSDLKQALFLFRRL